MNLAEDFAQTLRELGVEPGEVLIAGVSGGADSLALMHLLCTTHHRLAVTPVIVHVNHLLRGAESDADAEFVAGQAAAWGLPCHIERVDAAAFAARQRLSLEAAARQVRYAALARQAHMHGARWIVVGHHADDQAETVLMHFLRGAGLAGLRGMLPVSPLEIGGEGHLFLLRPLLGVTRAELEAYCAGQGLAPRQDRSNLDTSYTRNRLRHEIMPLLEQINPGLRTRLVGLASLAAADHEVLEAALGREWSSLAREAGEGFVRLDRGRWQALPLGLQRMALRRAAALAGGTLRDLGFRHIEAAADAARAGTTGAQMALPAGLRLRVEYGAVVIERSDAETPAPTWPLLPPGTAISIPLMPCVVPLPDPAWQVVLAPYEGPRSGPAWQELIADPWAAPLNLQGVTEPLSLRTRLPGDRFRPQGIGGTQKLSDFMINARIPARWRGAIPVLTAADQIVWLCGWRVAEPFIVPPQGGEVWLVRFEPV
ncbi:MAG: tRNA lysidine(34) synthetase TilS [Anaerolineae bacterium]